jgi:ParB-like nuclease domain
MHVDVRSITVGHVHAERGDPEKVARMHAWLLAHPDADLPPLDVRAKPDGTYRIYDGRHRFVAYVLAERQWVPIEIGKAERARTSNAMEL